METQPFPPEDAAAALGLVHAARAGLADRLVTPWWYHPVLGLLAGVAVLAYGTGSALLRALGVVVLLIGIGVLVQAYRRLTGVWVSGHHAGPARRCAVALAVVLGAATLGSMGQRDLTGSVLPSVPLAVLVAGATVLLGRRYDEVLRADLRSGGQPGAGPVVDARS